ncbi:phage protein [Staphylococcus petrasii]|uniref:Phage protein n=1 Tax=Staphylococcus petrasii TaxID=1276936 RepID=A0A380FZ04_9STAP|nr:hypothetical protein [Staphylococcus petrasii]PNZ25316.1 hypothetical protein CD137_11070 [Staphylococcus petrasii]TGE12711.1 hypothetical protein E2557_04205 [Staphylococcus petrasii]TGE17434.1 hypothetical protein BJR09_06465 [Staphylococcus petrasii]SUM43965.1 phage protein [Staphylococcus petrasii]
MDYRQSMEANDQYIKDTYSDVTIFYKTECDFYFNYNDFGQSIYSSFYLGLNDLFIINLTNHLTLHIPFSNIIEVSFDGEERDKCLRLNFINNVEEHTHFLIFKTLNEATEILDILENGSQYEGTVETSINSERNNRLELHPLNSRSMEKEINGKKIMHLDGLALNHPNAYKHTQEEIKPLFENREVLKIILKPSKSKNFQKVIALMQQFTSFRHTGGQFSIKVSNDMEYLEHKLTIEEIIKLIKNWKNKEVYIEGKLVTKILTDFKAFQHKIDNKIRWFLNYSHSQKIDFSLNEDVDAYITYYPMSYNSIFFAFRDSFETTPYMCSCTQTALAKLINGKKDIRNYLHPVINANLKKQEITMSDINFRDKICFRCNHTTPKYAFDKFGSRFREKYGWYFKQIEIEEDLKNNYYFKQSENILRQEYGVAKIGEKWTSETTMFKIIEGIFHEYQCKRHYRPDWLQGLEIDIYIPELKLGFEYNGIQHYEAVEHWGGETQFLKQQRYDQIKQNLCEENNIKLITIKYDEPLSKEYILTKIPSQYF